MTINVFLGGTENKDKMQNIKKIQNTKKWQIAHIILGGSFLIAFDQYLLVLGKILGNQLDYFYMV